MTTEPQLEASAPGEPTEEQLVESIVQYALHMLQDGKSREQIEAALMEKSVPRDFAQHVVSDLWQARSNAVRALGRKHMGIGAAWCIGGALVTWGTLAAAGQGGTYVVAWGAIIFGGLELLWGAWKALTG